MQNGPAITIKTAALRVALPCCSPGENALTPALRLPLSFLVLTNAVPTPEGRGEDLCLMMRACDFG